MSNENVENTEETEGTEAQEGSSDTAAEVAARTEADEAREAIEALRKLGPMFDRAVRALKPARLIAETQRIDRAAFFRNFKGQRLEKFTRPKLAEVLRKEIFDRGNAIMAHLLMVLWNDAMRDLYVAMRKLVETINSDVEAIERIEDDKAQEFVDKLLAKSFALEDIYVCVRINEVRFSEEFITAHVLPPNLRQA
jgi:hypothetical protein